MNIQPHNLTPLGRILDLSEEGYTVWDCSPIDGPDGRVHLFSTRWKPTDPSKPDATWFLGSDIIHSVAEKPEGPYEIQDIVLSGKGESGSWDSSAYINPKIYQVGDTYALVYTGCTDARHDTQAIGMLTAPSLDGPWTRVATDAPLIAPAEDHSGFDGYIANNPALLMHPNGQFWLYYKGRDVSGWTEAGDPLPGGMRIGLSIADQLEGPYRKHPDSPVIDLGDKLFEDPYVWHENGCFYLLASDMTVQGHYGGILFTSDDGITWSKPEKAYPGAAEFRGHGKQRLEEPNLLFRNGRPAYLFNVLAAVDEDPIYSGHVFRIEA